MDRGVCRAALAIAAEPMAHGKVLASNHGLKTDVLVGCHRLPVRDLRGIKSLLNHYYRYCLCSQRLVFSTYLNDGRLTIA